jgi:trigger factor
MKIEILEEKGSKIKVLFEVDDKSIFASFEKKALKELGEHVSIKGFRPGKIPDDVLRKHIDARLIQERTMELVAEDQLRKFVKEKDIAVVDTEFKMKKYVPGETAEFEIEIATFPVFTLPDYKKICKEQGEKGKKKVEVSKEDIDKSVDYLRKSRAKYKTSETGAKLGDFLEIDFEMTADGEKTEDAESKGYPFVLGEEKLIPGFEKEMEGLKPGDTKEFSLKAPKDYWRQDLANKKMNFKVKVNSVLERELPELNEEFAKSLGTFENMESVEKSIKDGLMMEKEKEEKDRFTESMIAKIVDAVTVDIPKVLIDRETEKIMHDFEHNLHSKGIEKEKYLKQMGKEEHQFKKELIPQAERNIKTYLVLHNISKAEEIEIPAEKIKEEMQNVLNRYKKAEDAAKEIDPENLYHYTKDVLTNKTTIDKLLEYANY